LQAIDFVAHRGAENLFLPSFFRKKLLADELCGYNNILIFFPPKSSGEPSKIAAAFFSLFCQKATKIQEFGFGPVNE